jgi:hypothetical protein
MKILLEQIASTIGDYRAGECPTPDATHVRRWINQFDAQGREALLRETAHVLGKTYLSRARCVKFIDTVAKSADLAGTNPRSFWRGVHFLRIQQGGHSQADMLSLFAAALRTNFGIPALPSGDSDTFIYLDDVSFSGNRILNDLRNWIANTAPDVAKVHIIVMSLHTSGQYYAHGQLLKAASAAGKSIEFKWWRSVEVEDRRDHTDVSDVLRPASIPNDGQVQAYVGQMHYQPVLRTPGNLGDLSFFSSDVGRHLLEQEFLKAGCRVRQMCPNLPTRHRPLGFSFLETLGFGTMMVTYRNCPNNAPLALWVGSPWIPLFPRKNN